MLRLVDPNPVDEKAAAEEHHRKRARALGLDSMTMLAILDCLKRQNYERAKAWMDEIGELPPDYGDKDLFAVAVITLLDVLGDWIDDIYNHLDYNHIDE